MAPVPALHRAPWTKAHCTMALNPSPPRAIPLRGASPRPRSLSIVRKAGRLDGHFRGPPLASRETDKVGWVVGENQEFRGDDHRDACSLFPELLVPLSQA
jgi:hypothetical protein